MEGRIKEIFVQKEALGYPFTYRILERLKDRKFHIIKEESPFFDDPRYKPKKDSLYLLVHKGSFLKPCPGTKQYICCRYQILNIGINCPLDCSYCILQAYFNQPYLRIFVNIEDGLKEVLNYIDERKDEIFRIGTGEFTDSLALDPITEWSKILIPHFSKRKNVILELKTKTGSIEGAISLPYRERIIISWSLNSPLISTKEEHGAISVEKRIKLAGICQKEGFVVGFHFDPLIFYPNWKEDYLRTIDLMERYLDPSKIIWISLGSFRYMPELKNIIIRRHKKSVVLNGEFIKGMDGKMRYFKPIRIELYSYMYDKLSSWYKDLGIYLCMESDDVWKESFGWSPKNSQGLKDFLDKRVIKFFGR